MPKINQTTLRALPVPLPPPELRAELVARLDRAFAVAATTLERLHGLSTRLERTNQAALAKAFRGELVPTEAALAEDEGREFESADQLLARISTTAKRRSPDARVPEQAPRSG